MSNNRIHWIAGYECTDSDNENFRYYEFFQSRWCERDSLWTLTRWFSWESSTIDVISRICDAGRLSVKWKGGQRANGKPNWDSRTTVPRGNRLNGSIQFMPINLHTRSAHLSGIHVSKQLSFSTLERTIERTDLTHSIFNFVYRLP